MHTDLQKLPQTFAFIQNQSDEIIKSKCILLAEHKIRKIKVVFDRFTEEKLAAFDHIIKSHLLDLASEHRYNLSRDEIRKTDDKLNQTADTI